MGSTSFGVIEAMAFAAIVPASIKIVRGIDACAMVSDRG
jgi:hypothetical protein